MTDKNTSLSQEFNLPETTPFWNERQLAQRWKLSLKTLQRWRSEGIGPVFVKMRSSVFYPIGEIILFEHSRRRRSTYESENDLFDVLPNDLIDALGLMAKWGDKAVYPNGVREFRYVLNDHYRVTPGGTRLDRSSRKRVSRSRTRGFREIGRASCRERVSSPV